MAMQEHFVHDVDNLFAASQIMPVDADSLQIAAEQNLKRGSLVTSAGVLCTNAEADPETETAADEVYAVLAEDCDTTDGAKDAAVYLTGDYNENHIIVGEGATAADFKVSARKVGIFIKPGIPY
jgi:hypothetical protein